MALGRYIAVCLLLGAGLGELVEARPAEDFPERSEPAAALLAPAYCQVEHNVGNMRLTVTNYGITGRGRAQALGIDCFTGEPTHSWEFPINSNTQYLYSSCFWVGAVVGEDTLVSTGYEPRTYTRFEWHPDESPAGDIRYRSVNDPDLPGGDSAVSEQDFISVFTDTCVSCTAVASDDNRPQIPLGLKITQRSYAWSYAHTEDFVLFDCTLRNIGTNSLHDVYVGQFVDGDAYNLANNSGFSDDETGFVSTVPSEFTTDPCAAGDSLGIAWIADNDGDLSDSYLSASGVMGLRLLYPPQDPRDLSYNWWAGNFSPIDFGPQARHSFRDFQTGGTGIPLSDRNRYHILRNGEKDYDQYFTAVIPDNDSLWLPPDEAAEDNIAEGMDTRFCLSAGPFQLEPGEEIPFAMAYISGDHFHWYGSNLKNLPRFPTSYRGNLDFSDLIDNALWAGWVYDNPGVDTDHNGYAGEFRECDGDTFWYQGDGVPDFRAVEPPVPPVTWLEPVPGGLRLRWNGFVPETGLDFLHRESRFEGYNVYLATQSSGSDFAHLASYDVDDYYLYYWDTGLDDWRQATHRFTLEALRCRYAPDGCSDTAWFPQDYPRATPYIWPSNPDSVFYFEPINANASRFGVETPIVKSYPEAPRPPFKSVNDVPTDSLDLYVTDDGYFKYYDYDYTITGLIPGEEYSLALTCFDYGSYVPGALPLESALSANTLSGVPLEGSMVCCVDPVGNVDCDAEDNVDVGDLQRLVDHLFLSFAPLCCSEEADLNRDGVINMVDLGVMLDHLMLSKAPLGPCPVR